MVQVLIRQPPVYLMPGIRGLRTWSGKNWKHPLYQKRKPVERPEPILTDEERAAQRARMDKIVDDFIAAANARLQPPPGPTPLDKIVDREARVSVEGDPDLNHDNLEG